jgi:hypothetical protein
LEVIKLNTIPDKSGNSLVLFKFQFEKYDNLFQRYKFVGLYFQSTSVDNKYLLLVKFVDIDGKIT